MQKKKSHKEGESRCKLCKFTKLQRLLSGRLLLVYRLSLAAHRSVAVLLTDRSLSFTCFCTCCSLYFTCSFTDHLLPFTSLLTDRFLLFTCSFTDRLLPFTYFLTDRLLLLASIDNQHMIYLSFQALTGSEKYSQVLFSRQNDSNSMEKPQSLNNLEYSGIFFVIVGYSGTFWNIVGTSGTF